MGLPTKKSSKGRTRSRAAHFGLKRLPLQPCPQCKKPRLMHRACPSCGHYGKRDVLRLSAKVLKKKAA